MKNNKGIKKHIHKAPYIVVLFVWIILIVITGSFRIRLILQDETPQEESKQVISIETMSVIDEYISESMFESSTENVIPQYTDADLYYLAAAVCREAGGASEEIQLLVANVIINRVNSYLYPDTIYGVLTDYKQYGTMWKYGVSFPDWANQKVIDQCYAVAKRILDGERFCPENVLFQAEFKQGSGIFKQFGDEYYFCYYG